MSSCIQYTVFQTTEMKTLYLDNDEKCIALQQFLKGKTVSFKWEIQCRFHTGMVGKRGGGFKRA
jgi:hypothetical protein